MGQRLLPEAVQGTTGVELRRWLPGDAEVLQRLVLESVDHLRAWMPWVADEPLAIERRTEMIAEWSRDWASGGDVYMGIYAHGDAVGSCGLHRRIGPGGLEIGYWIHPGFLRRGFAMEATRLLTDAAFAIPEIVRAEIHHDIANHASSGIPRNLGYQLVGEVHDETPDPGGTGISSIWRTTRPEWSNAHSRPDNGFVYNARPDARQIRRT
jgi:RimJ/RimL family protein N-acetyltransferase